MIWRDHENLAALFLQMVLTDDYQSEPSTRQWARIWLDTSNFLTQASCMLYYISKRSPNTNLLVYNLQLPYKCDGHHGRNSHHGQDGHHGRARDGHHGRKSHSRNGHHGRVVIMVAVDIMDRGPNHVEPDFGSTKIPVSNPGSFVNPSRASLTVIFPKKLYYCGRSAR